MGDCQPLPSSMNLFLSIPEVGYTSTKAFASELPKCCKIELPPYLFNILTKGTIGREIKRGGRRGGKGGEGEEWGLGENMMKERVRFIQYLVLSYDCTRDSIPILGDQGTKVLFCSEGIEKAFSVCITVPKIS